MKKLIVIMAVFAVTASLAYADRILDPRAYTITATPMSDQSTPGSRGIGWSNIDMVGGPYSLTQTNAIFPAEDYQCSAAVWPSTTFTLTSFKFIGGVAAVNNVLFFDFYHSNVVPNGANYYDYVGVMLPQAGNWIWNITLSTAKTIDTNGFMDMDATYTATTTGTWYADSSGPSIGTSNPGPYSAGTIPVTTAFEFTGTPEPASILLLGIAGLLLRRR